LIMNKKLKILFKSRVYLTTGFKVEYSDARCVPKIRRGYDTQFYNDG